MENRLNGNQDNPAKLEAHLLPSPSPAVVIENLLVHLVVDKAALPASICVSGDLDLKDLFPPTVNRTESPATAGPNDNVYVEFSLEVFAEEAVGKVPAVVRALDSEAQIADGDRSPGVSGLPNLEFLTLEATLGDAVRLGGIGLIEIGGFGLVA